MKSIGIIGGGQLSQMLLKEGLESGLDIRAYCQHSADPAYQVGPLNSIGNLDDPKSLQNFMDSVDICSFESELINCAQLSELKGAGRKFLPAIEIMSVLQDRKTQKESLDLHKLPTLPYFHSHYPEWLLKAAAELKYKVVFKERRNSYDGYGTHLCLTKQDVQSFIKKNESKLDQYILEPLFKFKRELAITAYRSKDGSTGTFPLVEWQAQDAKCHWVMGPIRSQHIGRIERKILMYLDKINYVGVMAFEIFDSTKGLFINEVAPRVHNSTHYSLDAMGFNQFLVHIKCLLGDKMPRRIEPHSKGFAMVNLIGTGAKTHYLQTQNESKLYWYGKAENRKGRKLGHINAVSTNPKNALKNALKGASLCRI